METRSRAAHLVRRPHYEQWAQNLLIAEAVLLILVAGGVGLVVAWDMVNDKQPSPTSTATLSLPRSLANANCIARSIEAVTVRGRTCISES
ncbi:MAG: hypothetical protein ACFB0C_11530 [Leptolyngbyaceae cyanobacterium]